MAAIGLGGCVTARGWIELANPASTRLSIRLFNVMSCSSRSSSRKPDSDNSELAEFTEIGEFQLALRTMRAAASFVMPWNFSFSALENFLVNSKFCKEDIGSLDKQAQLLTTFTDYILAENANKWRNSEPFLNAGELKTSWCSFFSARPQSALAKKQQLQTQPQQPPKRFQPPQTTTSDPTKTTRPVLPSIPVCYNWNRNQCRNPDGQCARFGKPMAHVCDHRPNPANLKEFCGQAHKRILVHQ
jgi:hypothetical protein